MLESNGIKYKKVLCKSNKTVQIFKALEKRHRAKPDGLQEDFLLSTNVMIKVQRSEQITS